MTDYTKFDKKVAMELYKELQEVLSRLPADIKAAPDNGPVMKIICDGLGTAITALKTTIRK